MGSPFCLGLLVIFLAWPGTGAAETDPPLQTTKPNSSSPAKEHGPTLVSFPREFLQGFRIVKSPKDPARFLDVFLPTDYGKFKEFIARVTDSSEISESGLRDSNRTFRITPQESTAIRIHGLNPGHRYNVAIFGRLEEQSVPIREEAVLMDPVPIDFRDYDILSDHSNITLRGFKSERAIQDKFSVKYFQIDPLKRFPSLTVNDIADQRLVELYLGNLSPGREYDVTVTSLKESVSSSPWRRVIATRPLSPTNLDVTDLNSTCLSVTWEFPSESGADQFTVEYVETGEDKTEKTAVPYGLKQQTDLCRGIVPGRSFNITVWAEKSNQSSESISTSFTMRPLPPETIEITPDYVLGQFRARVLLAEAALSEADHCQLSIQSDDAQRVELTIPVNPDGGKKQSCETFVDLTPGKRYDMSAAALNEKTRSKKILRSTVIEPSFNVSGFGIVLKETKGSLEVAWNDTIVRNQNLWRKTVGIDSKLHIRVDPMSNKHGKETSRQFDVSPLEEAYKVSVDHLRRGACYKIQMYTVTRTGIVSLNRMEQFLRLSPPPVEIRVGNVSKTSALIRITVLALMDDPLHPIIGDLSDCQLALGVVDSEGQVVLSKALNLLELGAPSVSMDGLRPYHKYTLKAKMSCGQKTNGSQCPVQEADQPPQSFETLQDSPTTVQNFEAKVLNPYSVQLTWLPPALDNGPITHYVVHVTPVHDPSQNWTIAVNPKESVAVVDGKQSHALVVDNLVGGLQYEFNVQAVNEAGISGLLPVGSYPDVLMPILPPPRPNVRVEVLRDTIQSTTLTVKFGSDSFSTKHGLLKKLALLVSQVGGDGRPMESNDVDRPNRTVTWGVVQKFDFWPTYTATEVQLDNNTSLTPHIFIVDLGLDPNCADLRADTLCNGPLKPGTSYRFKLRLFTAPALWTDSLYSDIVVTEPLRTSSAFRGVFTVLFVFISCGLLALLLLFVYTRRQRALPEKGGHAFHSGGFGGSGFASKENQWAALKMIMAERAADCLAKLGLDSGGHSPPPPKPCMGGSPPNVVFSSTAGPSEADCVRIVPPAASPPPPPPAQLAKTESSSALSASPAPFSAHHRRSRSLRERTGVDQRLERLPSGPPPGAKLSAAPWTVLKGADHGKSRPVRIADFPEHVKLMAADSDYMYSMEYEEFRCVGSGQTSIAAELPQNRAKNRFINILPYDHSRVKLVCCDEDDGSDYVNASYIPGFNSRREFIAAQGPLPSTRDHFWKVVWEQNCPAIVALTKCVEKGRDKCHQYWPDVNQRTVIYADVEVTLLNESVEYDEYVIRELRLTHLGEFGTPPRVVFHLHYMAWPDFGAPEHPVGIVNFWRIFRSRLPPSPLNRPSIIHCSAGVGRSGTFIAIDRLVQNIEVNKPIDVFGTVFEMRMERCHMVQNEQQYIFIHQSLLYVLQHFYPSLIHNPTPLWSSAALQSSLMTAISHDPPESQSARNPRIEVHQNPAFMEDDEGIAESGL